ncbi:MAG: hypothetical protein U9O41_06490, partial [Candidatus Aerophobetes bacterium]|nr:hypothetical protein [Candidatus Aerophobetes bacterium]
EKELEFQSLINQVYLSNDAIECFTNIISFSFQSLINQVYLSNCGHFKPFQVEDLRYHLRKAPIFEKDPGAILTKILVNSHLLILSFPLSISIFPKAEILRKAPFKNNLFLSYVKYSFVWL